MYYAQARLATGHASVAGLVDVEHIFEAWSGARTFPCDSQLSQSCRKMGLRFIRKEVPMPEDGELEPERRTLGHYGARILSLQVPYY